MTLLSPAEAAPIAGVPVVQLERWAWLEVGPRNSGTRSRPRYRREDVEAWRKAKERLPNRAQHWLTGDSA